MNTPEQDQNSQKNESVRSAGVVGLAVMGSRLLGLVREKVIALFFAAGVAADALNVAFRIPNMLRDLFAEGVLSKAFITTFTATETEDGTDAAWRLANRTLNFFGIILAAITLLGVYFTPEIVGLITGGKGFDAVLDPGEHFGASSKRELTILLTRIMFPFLALVSFAAIAMGVLNSKKIFGVPAWASSFFNITSLIVGVAGYYFMPMIGWHPAAGMAFGFLAGGAAQFAFQIPTLHKIGFRYQPLFRFNDPRLKQVLRLMAPAILGASALQINVFMNTIFASEGEGWITWLTRAFRLLHLPIGVFGVAISTVALPNLARLVAENKLDDFKSSFQDSFQLVLFFALPATIGLMLLAEPFCRLIFEGGQTTPVDTAATASALKMYAIGLCGFSAIKIVTDGFYAFQDTRTPVLVSLGTIALNITLNAILIYKYGAGHEAIAMVTAISVSLNFVTLTVLLPRKSGKLGFAQMAPGFLRLFIAATGLAVIVEATRWLIEQRFGNAALSAQFAELFAPIILGAAGYFIICKWLKVKALSQLLGALGKRKRN